jgi:hypothetical protein
MHIKKQIEALFHPLIGQKAWGASVGYGSFVTIEFGRKHRYHRRDHGEWHLWLYQCDWELHSRDRLLAHSESKKHVMQLAIDNLNGAALTKLSFDPQLMRTDFAFDNDLHLGCKPYPDADADEEYWMLFMPDQQVASLRESGLRFEPADQTQTRSLVRR